MKRFLMALAALMLAVSPAWAFDLNYTKVGPYQILPGSQYGLVLTTATALTVPQGALFATVIVETGSVRYSSTATPTATSGMLLTIGGPYTLAINPLSAVTFIDATGSSGTIDVEYFK